MAQLAYRGQLMKIPDGMTKEETTERINSVINKIAPRYTFRDYDVEDIKQEAFIICIDGLDRYDSSRPLENFLSVHLSNRLKNFIRDNYFIKDDEDRKRVMSPKYLASDDDVFYECVDINHKIDTKDANKVIDKFLPCEYRSDYLKILADVYVPKRIKQKIMQIIEKILREHGYE